MYYSSIGLLALIILLIENRDILFGGNGVFDAAAWKEYRRFLYAVLLYYVTDILWGLLDVLVLPVPLFIDTSVYFVMMAVGVLLWTRFVVAYLSDKGFFGRFLVWFGHIAAVSVTCLLIVNIFVPVMFSIDENGTYKALWARYLLLSAQFLLHVLTYFYAYLSIRNDPEAKAHRQRYRAVASFGLIVAVFLVVQVFFPLLPIYAVAYMLGISMLRTIVVQSQREEYLLRLEQADEVKKLKQSMTSLLDNIPGLTFSKDAETGVYLACNQAFAEYAHKTSPEGVVGLTDMEIFDKETATHFIEDDKLALSMDEPYIFFEDVPDAAGNQRQFQTTKVKFTDASGRLCTLGMSQDVTDLIRIQRENATTKEEYEKARSTGIILSHIAQTLARGYAYLYYVNLETGEFRGYHTNDSGVLEEEQHGEDFFDASLRDIDDLIYPEDRAMVRKVLEKKRLLNALDRNKNVFLTYRMLTEDGPTYFNMQISRMEDDDRFIVVGVTDIDEEVRQRTMNERIKEESLAYTRLSALSGDLLCVYVVEPETGHYREFSSVKSFNGLNIPEEGTEFFDSIREHAKELVFEEDRERFLLTITRDEVLSEIQSNGIFATTVRFMMNDRANYVQIKAAMVEEKEGARLIVGLSDVDSHVRREEEYARRLAQAQSKVNIDALTGIRNKYAYLDEENRLEKMVAENRNAEFALVILDVNELKKVNDTSGHQAGDKYIQDACKLICDIFKHSPVFRIGGDEFAVVVEKGDYENLDTLVGNMNAYNAGATRTGGLVVACGTARHESGEDVTTVFAHADHNMYADKARLKEEKKKLDG